MSGPSGASGPSVPDVERAARRADDSDWVDRLAAYGLVSFGVVHLVLGWLAVQLALGDREGSSDTQGAVQQLAEQPFGGALVWLVAVGLVVLAAWQAFEAVVGHRDEEGAKRWGKRVLSAARAVVYGVIAAGAVSKATGSSGGGGGGGGTDATTAKVMNAPGGQVLVGLAGLVVVGVGVGLVVVAVREKYLDSLQARATSGRPGSVVRWLGRAGHVAKGVALGVVGGLFVYAAATHEPRKSGGLDEALRQLLEQPFGPVVLTLMGLGFAAYGAFCLVKARYLDR